ncbi:porin family protein [Pontibacter anaerobius]|uniref:Porin family protein n=1 Tax=Pontibacter anaerobius TaxID=2993940 RepID=A0ABT3RIL9_9BACT|nr:porin family protein [Pontibacter anaerobius]MCX2741671.1 porin family protein [Pontibacter anaerobius]
MLLFILACTLPAAAQSDPELTIGAKAGINFYSLSSDDLVEDNDAGVGYELGIYGRIGEGIFVQPELNLVRYKTHLITRNQPRVGERDAVTVTYVRIPVLLGYRTDYDGMFVSRVRVMAGPSISYALSVADNNLNIQRKDIHNMQFALNGGVGFELWKLHLDLLYHHFFTSLLNDGRSEGKGRAFSVTAGLGF